MFDNPKEKQDRLIPEPIINKSTMIQYKIPINCSIWHFLSFLYIKHEAMGIDCDPFNLNIN